MKKYVIYIVIVLILCLGLTRTYQGITFNSNGTISFTNGASINNTDADTLELTESKVKITGDLVVTGDVSGAISTDKAFAYLDSNAVAIDLTQNVWSKVTGFIQGDENGVLTFSGDTIYASLTGTYQATFDPSCAKGAGATANLTFGFSIDGAVPLNKHRTARQFTTTDRGSIAMSKTLYLTAGQYVVVKVRNTTNNDDITFVYGEFELSKE